MWMVIVGSVWAAPVCPASPVEFSAALDDAEKAFSAMDPVSLRAALADAQGELACTSAVLTPVVAARLHRAEALAAFVEGDEGAARRALYAARLLDPTGGYPAALIALDHPIRALEPVTTPAAPPILQVPPPSLGTVYFDGHPGLDRPADRPTVYQLASPRGTILQGFYVLSDAAMPAYPAPSQTVEVEAPRKARTSIPLGIVGAVGLLGAGVTYGLAGASHAAFIDPTTPTGEIEGLFDQTNTRVYASIGLATLGVAGGAGALIVGKW